MAHRLSALRRRLMTPCGEPCNVMEQGGPHVLSALNPSYISKSIGSARVRECGSPGTGSRSRSSVATALKEETYPDFKKLHGGGPNPCKVLLRAPTYSCILYTTIGQYTIDNITAAATRYIRTVHATAVSRRQAAQPRRSRPQ